MKAVLSIILTTLVMIFSLFIYVSCDDDDDDDDSNSAADCEELISGTYESCDLSLESMSASEAYVLCVEDNGPWDCLFACIADDDVNGCNDFALCAESNCDVSTDEGSNGNGQDDDDNSNDPINVTCEIEGLDIHLERTSTYENVLRFYIYRSVHAENDYSQVGTVTGNLFNFTDAGISEEGNFDYTVAAEYEIDGNTSVSDMSDFINCITAPNMPYVTLVDYGYYYAGLITIFWEDESDMEKQFRIYRKDDQNGEYKAIDTTDKNMTGYAYPPGSWAEEGKVYYHGVAACNNSGCSEIDDGNGVIIW